MDSDTADVPQSEKVGVEVIITAIETTERGYDLDTAEAMGLESVACRQLEGVTEPEEACLRAFFDTTEIGHGLTAPIAAGYREIDDLEVDCTNMAWLEVDTSSNPRDADLGGLWRQGGLLDRLFCLSHGSPITA